MKTNEIIISPLAGEKIKHGSLWIYRNEIQNAIDSFSPGEIVRVKSGSGEFVGKGYINPSQTISVRLLTTREERIDPKFFENKIREAVAWREKIGFGPEKPRRLVHSEGDGLAGLVVDQYHDVLVAQFLTAGIEKWKRVLLRLLQEILLSQTVIEKSAGEGRSGEGLPERFVFHGDSISMPQIITMDDLRFSVDFLEGHKTGFYLDQSENRLRLSGYAKGKRILDAFAYTGAMSLYAAKFGASRVDAVEDSRKVFPFLERNIKENGYEGKIHTILANAFHFLRERRKENTLYDCVILDPPAFARSKRELNDALRGYKELQLSALKLLSKGGFLITYTCSQAVRADALLETAVEAAADARASLQLVERHGISRDHPARAGMPETDYLKGFVFRKM